MTSPTTIELKNIDPDDIGAVLQKVEKSFGFQFGNTELKDVNTFGELCDIIANKIQGDNSDDCTTQQAFYKLKAAILVTTPAAKNYLTIDTTLEQLFPRQARRRQVNSLDEQLGFKISILRPKHWVALSFILIFFASLIGLYFSWRAGLAVLAASILTYKLTYKFGKEMDIITVGELSEKIAREHYRKVRRNSATINRNEVAKKVKKLFMTDLDLEEETLTREATFG
jgi:preprotein translocase subunit SecF